MRMLRYLAVPLGVIAVFLIGFAGGLLFPLIWAGVFNMIALCVGGAMVGYMVPDRSAAAGFATGAISVLISQCTMLYLVGFNLLIQNPLFLGGGLVFGIVLCTASAYAVANFLGY